MKKRILSVILCALMLVSILPAGIASAFTAGDIDNDTNVSAADARLVLRASVGLETFTAEQIAAADVDGVEGISAADARLVLRASVGLETLHQHAYTPTVTKPATCTADGIKTFTCSCGDSYTEAIAKTGHVSVADKAVAATCTTAGKTAGAHCSKCNAVLTAQTVIPATGHKTSALDNSTVKAVTCTTDGYTGDKKCTVCKTVTTKGSVVKSKGTEHVFEIQVIEADCITPKYEMKKCKYCDYIDPDYFKELGSAKGHKFSAATTTAPTCEEQGFSSKTCSVCHATEKFDYVDALVHEYKPVRNKVTATCQNTGIQVVKCSKCNDQKDVVMPLTECKASNTPITEDENGNPLCKEIYVCKTCNKELYTIEKHRYRDIGFVKVSCTENGTTTMECLVCEKVVTKVTAPALGHAAEIDLDLSSYATCEEPGYMVYHGNCTREGCNAALEGQTVEIPKKGHETTGKQTCTESVVCTRPECGKTVAPALGHSMTISSAWAANTDSHAFFCARCGAATDTTNAAKIANFNTITSAYKRINGQYATRYFTKSYTDSTYKTFDFGIYTSMIEDMYKEEMGKSEDEYTPVRLILTKQSPITETVFSKLTAYDLDSMTVERLSGLSGAQVLSSFNPGYSAETTSYEHFNRYKSLAINENVIKVTMDVKNENLYTIVNSNIEETALQRIYEFDVRQQVNGYQLSGGKYVMSEKQTGDGYEMSMSMTVESIDTDAKVTFYLLESTYEPIMAVYDIYDTIDSSVNMTFKIGISIKGKMRPVIKTHNTSVFVFERTIKNFTTEA